jgi:hypothetical protein
MADIAPEIRMNQSDTGWHGGDEAPPSESPNREAKKWRAKKLGAKNGIGPRWFPFFTQHLFANLRGGDEAPPSGVSQSGGKKMGAKKWEAKNGIGPRRFLFFTLHLFAHKGRSAAPGRPSHPWAHGTHGSGRILTPRGGPAEFNANSSAAPRLRVSGFPGLRFAVVRPPFPARVALVGLGIGDTSEGAALSAPGLSQHRVR